MRVCVFGAGAIGGHIAVRLARSGASVAMVARTTTLAAVRRHGVIVEAPDGKFTASVEVSDDPAALGPQDVVFVTVKAPALSEVAASIAPLLGDATPVVFAMNGIPWWYFHACGGALDGTRLTSLDPDGALWRTVGPERAVGGVVYSSCTVTAPGVIRVEGASRFVLGRPDGSVPRVIAELVESLRAGGVEADAVSRIRDAVWTKLLINLMAGPLAVLAGGPARVALREPACLAAARRMIAEGRAIAEALGCEVTCDVDAIIAENLRLAHKPSILQDLELGRPMEIDALYEAPLGLARMAGVQTPTLDLLIGLVKARARTAGLYV